MEDNKKKKPGPKPKPKTATKKTPPEKKKPVTRRAHKNEPSKAVKDELAVIEQNPSLKADATGNVPFVILPKKMTQKSPTKRKSINPEDYPLSARERKFIDLLKLNPANKSEAYRRAGYTREPVAVSAIQLCEKPNVAKAIKIEIGDELLKFGVNATSVLQRIAKIAMCDTTDIAKFENGRLKIIEDDELTDAGRALISEMSEHVSAKGDVTLTVKAKNQIEYMKLVCQYLGVLERANRTKVKPHEEQVEQIKEVINGKKSVVEASLYLESIGVALPEIFRILLTKQDNNQETVDDTPIPTAEEMWQRRKEKMAEIEKQREGLPQVREEVAAIKKELGDKVDAFKPEKLGDGE
jgi:phage terminase small subunit